MALLQNSPALAGSFAKKPAKKGLFCFSYRALLQNSPFSAGSFATQPAKTRLFCQFFVGPSGNQKTTVQVLTKLGLFCKRALQDQGSHAKEPYKYMALLQKNSRNIGLLPANIGLFAKSLTNVMLLCMKVLQEQGSFAKEPRAQREYGKHLPNNIYMRRYWQKNIYKQVLLQKTCKRA